MADPAGEVCRRRRAARTFAALGGILLLAGQHATAAAQSPAALQGGRLNATADLTYWQVTSYGAAPIIAIGSRQGPALQIHSGAPSDTAVAQELHLQPHAFYRIEAGIATDDLDAHGAPICGAVEVQRHNGTGVLAASANRYGTSPWRTVSVFFRVPSDGIARICLFFTGFAAGGGGTGTAWFRSVRIRKVDPSMAPLKITSELLKNARISRFQYGQFVEYLCTLIPAMWAEKLYDGSFEGLGPPDGADPYNFEFIRQTDYKEKPWYPCGEVNRGEYSHDSTTRVSGAVSQRIAITGNTPATAGIAQDGVAVNRRIPCKFHIWLRADGVSGPVMVRLHRGPRLLAECHFTPTTKWARYAATLSAAATTNDATLSIEFRGPGTLWLDSASLTPTDAILGWRRDVVKAVRALKPRIIRFGGSALDDPARGKFNWKATIGDPDKRAPFRAWGGLQPAGAGLEEIVQFCGLVGAKVLMCVRTTNNTPENAAEEVQYFNGAVTTPMGALRARNGHPEPYGITWWQVGNERASKEYETELPEFCRAMLAADPNIRLMSSYPTPGVLEGAGQYLSCVCPHHYNIGDMIGTREGLESVRELIQKHGSGRNIHVGVTEWNTTGGDEGVHRARLWTLENALACSRYQNLLQRNSDLVVIANRSNLINSFCSGIVQTNNHALWVTPTYYAQQLYSTMAGDYPLKIDSETGVELDPDISATISADRKTVTVFAVNESGRGVARPLDFSAFGHPGTVQVTTLADSRAAGEPDAFNSFDHPTRVGLTHAELHVQSAKFDYTFPPWSLTVLRLKMP
ncbi:MAG: hypothetical protein KGJ62_00350 [Armatimonadetes bacterium]|nr:hypothetical protein [Armatimonadota bacterium]MDE2207348.1 hypothetical protein [Armatimonadota bacterium]